MSLTDYLAGARMRDIVSTSASKFGLERYWPIAVEPEGADSSGALELGPLSMDSGLGLI